jgi:hypothetical protein
MHQDHFKASSHSIVPPRQQVLPFCGTDAMRWAHGWMPIKKRGNDWAFYGL